jgi:BirA family biotin operon repressor/biotin-[acetyl-CoA-carboxylase] ligase
MTQWPESVERRVHDTLDSTMAEAARLGPTTTAPVWILAHHQTAARGRRGRVWHQPPGNFSATLLMRPEGSVAERALRSFVAALALRDAFVAATGQTQPFTLKWPNDVLAGGRKVAGILLESMGDSLAIGIGVNLVETPDPATLEPWAVPPVSLADITGLALSPEQFLDHLAPAYAAREAQLTTLGFAPIRTAWLTHAARLGEVITARTGSRDITGTFQTVDDTGALVLKAPDGVHTIPAADVYF